MSSSKFSFAQTGCSSIADIACNTDGFSTLCTAIQTAGLTDYFSSDTKQLTVFAPTDEAFSCLPHGVLDALLKEPEALKDILYFHVVETKVSWTELQCTGLMTMANGWDSRTVCRGPKTYQKGNGNSPLKMPEIVSPNQDACNGVVHVVNQVLLPHPVHPVTPPQQCSSITKILCGSPTFSTLCAAVKAAGLADVLNGPDEFTVFAPTNAAFASLPDGTLDALQENIPVLTDLLLFHTTRGAVYGTDLICKDLLTMSNGIDSRTVCRENKVFQKGNGNSDEKRPQIIDTDKKACNGVVHVVSEVMIPKIQDCQTITETICTSPVHQTLCQALGIAGLKETLNATDKKYTVFAPTDAAFSNLPQEALQGILGDPISLEYLLLFHGAEGIWYASYLECTQLLTMLNGEKSRTVCEGPHRLYQKGARNSRGKMPLIQQKDIETCNGVVHVVNQVMLP